jgi:hypothetical protein
MVDIEQTVANNAQKYIVIANNELAHPKTHWQAAVAATSGLKKHDGPAIAHHLSDGFESRRRNVDTRRFEWANHATPT